jgi:YggT family protein
VILANFLKAFAQLFHMLVQLYILIIIIRSVLSWMGNIPPNAFTITLRRLTDPLFRWVHKKLPFTIIGGIDISPIIIVMVLYFADIVIFETLMDLAYQMKPGGRVPGY